jgi:predicted transcriptional regulator
MSAAWQIADEDLGGLTDEQRQIIADQDEGDLGELDPELERAIDEGLAQFEAGDRGIPHETVMQRLRSVL